MQNEQDFSNLIYEYFFLRIRFGYYRCGDSLPSIDTLCREFNVAPLTVTAALRRLRSEGFISMHNGRPTMVLYQLKEGEEEEFCLRFYAERWPAFMDLYASSELILIPLEVEGLRRMDNEDLAEICRLAKRGDADDLLHFFWFTLQKLDNPLALNLFWESTQFMGFPFAKKSRVSASYSPGIVRQRLNKLIRYIKARDWNTVRELLLRYQRDDVSRMTEAFGKDISPLPKEEMVPFTWRIYRERPQVRYDLAFRLLHEIYMGEYREKDFLPSYEKMAQKYQVSVSTIRRTVNTLCQTGAARAINGRGTQIFTAGQLCDAPDFESPAIRRSLAFFVQSFELLIYTCEGVTRNLLSSVSQADKDILAGELRNNLLTGRTEFSLWCYLLYVGKYSPLEGIRVIYSGIYSLFLWGYPLKASFGNSERVDNALLHFTELMLSKLAKNDIDGCAIAVRELLSQMFPYARQYLLAHGIKEEEMRLTPCIHLQLTT